MPANPFQYLRPVPPQDFVGRWGLVNEIAENLLVEGGDSHAVIAGRRCGKSSLMLALAYQLRQTETLEAGDWTPLIVPFDFKSSKLASEGGCLAELFESVRRHVDVSVRRRPTDAWPTPVALEAGWFLELQKAGTLSLQDFEDGLAYILDQIRVPDKPVRLVLLIDEMDEPLGFPWTDALFNQLRALIYSSDLKEQVRLVLTGSRRFLDEVSNRGSPLWNVLMFHYLQAMDEASIRQLAERARKVYPEGLAEEVVAEVWRQCGGQPFLAQCLLYELFQEEGRLPGSAATIQSLAEGFIFERIADLEGWARAMEAAGLLAYRVLVGSGDWMDETEIGRAVGDATVNVKRGLTALCFHGTAIHDGSWRRYRQVGDLFKAWFATQGAAFLPQAEKPATVQVVPGEIHARTVIISASTQVEVGDEVMGDKVEGDKVGGDKITTGDIEGGGDVAIGGEAADSGADT